MDPERKLQLRILYWILLLVCVTNTLPIKALESRKLVEKCTPCGDNPISSPPPIIYNSPPPPVVYYPSPPPPSPPPPIVYYSPPPPTPKKSPSSNCPPPPSSPDIYMTGPPGNLYPVDVNFSGSGATPTGRGSFAGILPLFVCLLSFLAFW